MIQERGWSKKVYEASISSRCWVYTPYDQGWGKCPDLREDRILQELVALEQVISPVPDWAREIVEKAINYPPFCPHYAFPQPYVEVEVNNSKLVVRGVRHAIHSSCLRH